MLFQTLQILFSTLEAICDVQIGSNDTLVLATPMYNEQVNLFESNDWRFVELAQPSFIQILEELKQSL